MRRKSQLLIMALLPFLAVSCNPVAGDSRSAVILVVTGFSDTDGDRSGMFSDVVNDDTSVSDDFLFINTVTEKKAPSTEPSDLFRVTLFAYEVRYTRPDGANEPGVDVPFPFTFSTSGTILPEESSETEIFMVRKEAKLESPLRDLWFGDGQRIFATATVTIFGQDQVENSVSAAASIPIIFEDL